LESLATLEEKIRVVLSVLGLLPSSYHEVSASVSTAELGQLQCGWKSTCELPKPNRAHCESRPFVSELEIEV
jgi:hypothetical protein